MFKSTPSFTGYSIDDAAKVRPFYSDILGVETADIAGMEDYGMFNLLLAGGGRVLLYQKPNHEPASFTVLSFVVDDIDSAVDSLAAKGIETLRYPSMSQDEKGISRGLSHHQGPDIAWIADPAGNVIAILQDTPSPRA